MGIFLEEPEEKSHGGWHAWIRQSFWLDQSVVELNVFLKKAYIQLDNRLQVLTLLSPCRDSQTATKQSEF